MMRTFTLAVAATLLLIAATAAGASPAKWYWTEDRAAAVLVARFKMPYCRWQPTDAKVCAPTGIPLPGHPNLYGFALGDATCTGASELRDTFKYARFQCRVVSMYSPYFRSTIAVYPTGPATFRWKALS